VAQGTADFALVTDEAMREASFTLNHGLEAVPLGKITMHLAMSPTHALAQGCQRSAPILTAALSRFDFASPTRSMFCGRKRGIGSDDWRDEELPRRIRYWVDDLQVLIELVQSGRALAYLPDQLLAATGLKRVIVSDSPFRCEEQVFLLWRPARADGWQRTIVDSLEVAADAAGLPRSATSNTATRSVSAIRTSPTEHA
ncbi:MAG: LysR substrate-binding domain-containing protein, partial [Luteimonas sp.]